MRTESSVFELLLAAQYNLDNLTEANPLLKIHPHYIMARHQLDEAVQKLGGHMNHSLPPEDQL